MIRPHCRKILTAVSIVGLLLAPSPHDLLFSDQIPTQSEPGPLPAAVSGGLTAILARADDVLVRSMLPAGSMNPMKGEIAERLGSDVLQTQLRETGDWSTLRARFGRQGLDELLGKMDDLGRPRAVMVVEHKYGGSRLGQTNDGIQMGNRWSARRLSAVGSRYRLLAQAMGRGEIKMSQAPPTGPFDEMPVPMKGGTARFIRESSLSPWTLSSEGASSKAVYAQINRWADLLDAAAAGEISVDARLMQILSHGNGLEFVVRDATFVDRVGGDISRLPVLSRTVMPLDGQVLESFRGHSASEISETIRRQLPHLNRADAGEIGLTLSKSLTDLDDVHAIPSAGLIRPLLGRALAGGAVAAAVDPALRFLAGERDYRRLSVSAAGSGSVVLGAMGVGEAVTVQILRSPMIYSGVSCMADELGIRSTALLARGFGSFTTLGLTAVALPFVEYELGIENSTEASREAFAGGLGVVSALGVAGATLALVAAYGTASTGTAIATLSGAASTSATMAWLGGGSLAAGGFGVTGGTALIATGVGVVVVVVSGAVMLGFHYYDDKMERDRITLTLDSLSKREHFAMGRVTRSFGYQQSDPSK